MTCTDHYTARFQAYARTKGLPPERCPAGAGFITWITGQIKRWKSLTGTTGPMTAKHHEQFDRWLASTTGAKT